MKSKMKGIKNRGTQVHQRKEDPELSKKMNDFLKEADEYWSGLSEDERMLCLLDRESVEACEFDSLKDYHERKRSLDTLRHEYEQRIKNP